MPRPVEAFPCGSRSTISTRSPMAASAVPRLMAVVVLPTPPFWLAIAKTRAGSAVPSRTSPGNGRISPVWSDKSDIDVVHLTAGSALLLLPATAPQCAHDQNAAGRAGPAGHQLRVHSPIFSGLGQF